MKKYWKPLLLLIVLLSAILLFRIDRADVTGDSATYLYRSVGYIDYMSSTLQTTPLQWLSEIPWWVRIGFHDAPALYFGSHHLVMQVFGASPIPGRILHALLGVIIGVLLWLYTLRRSNQTTAWLAIAVFVALTPLITIHRSNLLESFMIIWLVAGLFSFFRAVQSDTKKYWYLTALFFGLALLTKYTAIFVIAGPMLWLLLHPKKFLNKHVVASMALLIILLLPIIVYNVMMYKTIGHPDLQFSSFLNFDTSAEWPVIQRTLSDKTGGNFFASMWKILTTAHTLVLPTITALLLTILGFFMYFTYKKSTVVHSTLLFSLALAIIGTKYTGISFRFLTPAFAMMAMITAVTLIDIYKLKIKFKRELVALLIIICASGWVMTAQTNYAYAQPQGIWENPAREQNNGYQELDAHFRNFYKNKYPNRSLNIWGYRNESIALAQEFMRVVDGSDDNEDPFDGMLIYDGRMSWFQRLWYYQRWNLYNAYTHVTTYEFQKLINENPTIFDSFTSYSFVIAHEPDIGEVGEDAPVYEDLAQSLVERFTEQGATTKTIYTPDGRAAFTIYGEMAK